MNSTSGEVVLGNHENVPDLDERPRDFPSLVIAEHFVARSERVSVGEFETTRSVVHGNHKNIVDPLFVEFIALYQANRQEGCKHLRLAGVKDTKISVWPVLHIFASFTPFFAW
jgi:hypothetical protein